MRHCLRTWNYTLCILADHDTGIAMPQPLADTLAVQQRPPHKRDRGHFDSGIDARTALLRQPPGLRQSSASWDTGSLALVGASP